jgi:hypothetical protein
MRQRKNWVRFRGGCGGIWQHSSGWVVHHCGHPTAIWPYYGVSPEGRMLLAPNGRAFGLLLDAQEAVEDEVRKERANGFVRAVEPYVPQPGADPLFAG